MKNFTNFLEPAPPSFWAAELQWLNCRPFSSLRCSRRRWCQHPHQYWHHYRWKSVFSVSLDLHLLRRSSTATWKALSVSRLLSPSWFPTLCAVPVQRRLVSCLFSTLLDFLWSLRLLALLYLPPVLHLRVATCGCATRLHPRSAQSLTRLICCGNAIMFPAPGGDAACVQSTGVISPVSRAQGSCGCRCSSPPPAPLVWCQGFSGISVSTLGVLESTL